jgi:polyisoprenoid-binding protein YceI
MELIRFKTLLAMLTIFIAYLPFNLQAKEWQVNSENSSIRYIYSLEGAAFRGRFREFSAKINFDSQKPEDGTIIGIVNMISSKSSSAEHDEYLMEEDWFNPNNHPESQFTSEKIIRNDKGGNFIAYGNLTLAGISQPIEMEFDFEVKGSKANFSGSFEIKRLLFGVGWDTTNWIADEVDVQIKLELN